MVHRAVIQRLYDCPIVPLINRKGKVMSQGSVYNCKNHPNMRWFDTKPNGALVFAGEITEDNKLKHPAFDSGNPMEKLRHYINGKNPYEPSLDLSEPFTYERLKQYMKSVMRAEEMGYAYECECSAFDLIRLPDETYETVHDRSYIP